MPRVKACGGAAMSVQKCRANRPVDPCCLGPRDNGDGHIAELWWVLTQVQQRFDEKLLLGVGSLFCVHGQVFGD